VQQELPALFEPGAFLVLSMRFSMARGNALAYLQLLIDVHAGYNQHRIAPAISYSGAI
jgi:hypothetical protein